MSAPATGPVSAGQAVYNKARLFLVASLGLATAGMDNALRANTVADLQRVFLRPDRQSSFDGDDRERSGRAVLGNGHPAGGSSASIRDRSYEEEIWPRGIPTGNDTGQADRGVHDSGLPHHPWRDTESSGKGAAGLSAAHHL